MDLRIYNTLSRQKETFKSLKKNWVSFYHCGPTVYWTQHLGNLRGMFCADIVVRVLKYLGYQVRHVRNYTDVGHLTGDHDKGEDKIEKSARREKISPQEIAHKYIRIFEDDTQELNLLEPTFKPRATQSIDDIIKMVRVLLDKDYAYATDLAVYFNVSKFKNYNQLSGQKPEEKLRGAGRAKVSDPQKKQPTDFALWFFKAGRHKNALQYWDSPFKSSLVKNGQGFPGWHIECSVMAQKYLGRTIDLHMGGIEHIPVHHTNEIAQSESANGVKFVNYWLHNEHLLFNNQKMAKSEGIFFTLDQVKEKGFSPLALRYLFLQAHYRSKQSFSWPLMGAAQKGFLRLVEQVKEMGRQAGKINPIYQKKFIEKISDDFNSPQAFSLVQKLLKSDLPSQDKRATLLDFDQVFGLKLAQIGKEKTDVPSEIKKLVDQREQARQEKNWVKADQFRKEIEKKKYKIEDTKKGPKLSPR
ncbi:MAG: cysteine--tRNA ligase [Candidatus Portnoybacteria bacterium CG03_land_8_20_14_0_80_41_10]|uniref:Cysteine--tRNA ligase n=1 Tax=Candidatus Portnoybacteria bacterium CG03_land_8_20_14_0_80_41_10 TaxID=1974808 RepID=A0A2M7BVC1_9BACT|nr:MAG: cysteine--tRNA ligase [Candidatus Portnoybacteria bacterium CG03_land_8_20_14_0_80_41_10]